MERERILLQRRKEIEMKIRITETEIEADARELRESQTLAQNFVQMLSRAFQSSMQSEDEDGGEEDERSD